MPDKYVPKGAIRTKEEFLALAGPKEVTLWYVYGSHVSAGQMHEIRLGRNFKLNGRFFLPVWTDYPCTTEFSLQDCNIPLNNYNAHFLFTEKADAEAYQAEVREGYHGRGYDH